MAEEKQELEQEQGQKQEKQTFVLDNGEEGSRAAYIRQEFQKDRSRKEIAEELGVRYNIVFSATANMFNAKHPEGGGTGQAKVAEDPRTGEQRLRKDIMRELYEEGWTRGEIAHHFQCPYGTVYGATRDIEPPEGARNRGGGKVMMTHPDTGEEVPRVDFIREKFAEGWSRREIADAAGCDYSVVWMATKEDKDEGQEQEDKKDKESDEDPDL